LTDHGIEGANINVIVAIARNIDKPNLAANYAAITAMARCAMTNLFEVIRFNDRDKFAEGTF
jgi:hypothetical protein